MQSESSLTEPPELQTATQPDPYIKSNTQDLYRLTTTQIPNNLLNYADSIKGHEFERNMN